MEQERIEKMKKEKAELEQRITKLLAFMESDKFNNIDDAEKRLLRQQYAGMETYLIALSSRLLSEDMKRYQCQLEKIKTEMDEMLKQGKSEEEVSQFVCEKVNEIQRIGENQFNDLQSIVMSGMMYSEMCKK
jgi:hypothetical protein